MPDPETPVTDVLRQYSRYFIGGDLSEAFAQGLLALERNWRGPLKSNIGVDTTLAQFRAMEAKATPAQKLNWRFQQALYRAYYDAYVRSRLLAETAQEERAMAALRSSEIAAAGFPVACAAIRSRACSLTLTPIFRARASINLPISPWLNASS